MFPTSIPFGSIGILEIGDERLAIKPLTLHKNYDEDPVLTAYVVNDVFSVSNAIAARRRNLKIEKVIFNNPATIVVWSDGTKTVVKCQPGDTYSKETGLALCIAKKFLGNKGNFNEVFKKWIPEETEPVEEKVLMSFQEDVETGEINLLTSNGISIGEKVRVIDRGQHYSGYSDWIELHVKDPGDVAKWGPKHDRYFNTGNIGVVKCIAPHEWKREGDLAYVEIEGYCYIINVKGLEKVEEA